MLKPEHLDLLDTIIEARRVPLSEVDLRRLRPLRREGLVRVEDDAVTATAAGKAHRQGQADSQPGTTSSRLNDRQMEALRQVVRGGGLGAEQVDGRILRALASRGLVRQDGGRVIATSAGDEALRRQPAPRLRRSRASETPEAARAQSISRAVEQLESAIPHGAEVLVGNIMASADDVLAGFRAHARRLAKRG